VARQHTGDAAGGSVGDQGLSFSRAGLDTGCALCFPADLSEVAAAIAETSSGLRTRPQIVRAYCAGRVSFHAAARTVRASTTQGERADAGPLARPEGSLNSQGETWISVGESAASAAVNSAILACIKRLYG
jgi:hypothetical protein